ncbi:MAG: transglycosylase SLT domain-containing protein, partial [Gemmatimonadota bacterium]|nr:transglycosylase SLT domain-containing protein [Gemmatimonadota bacterium]
PASPPAAPGADSLVAARAAPTPAPARDTAAADSASVSDRDIASGASSVFGDSAAAADSASPSWDMDVRSYEARDQVQKYVSQFTGPARDHITQEIERGTRYEGMIRAQFRAAGLPEDMYYLGLIESGYDPNAYSSAAAVGMWQFMAGTARGEGLRVDWWIDERRDPVKSTAAAAHFIKGLRDQFGSLYLAAAAYDGGPGRIQRGLDRYASSLQGAQGDDRFFELADKDYLRAETREYVPRLIAAALIGKNPKRYGLDIRPESAFVYDSVRVGPATPLAAIARASGTSVASLEDLNPQILRGMAPPDDSIQVRIPPGGAAGFWARYDSLPRADRVGVRRVRSRSGEYSSTIARKFGLTLKQLDDFNPKLRRYRSGHLVPGQLVLVPTRAVAEAARAVPNPSIELYGLAGGRHVVRKGETLGGLALKYHTTVARIKALNGLHRNTIYIGQKLRISR